MFRCKRCGFCCQLDVRLSEKDIKRLEDSGQKGFYEHRVGSVFLKRKNGSCIFYDDGCMVYDARPDICRDFPVLRDGTINPKCTTREDFFSKVDRRVIMFINEEIEKGDKK